MAKNVYDQAEIDRLVEEKTKEYRKQFAINHTPVVTSNLGNTYITVKKYDSFSKTIFDRIGNLLNLMNVDYSVSIIVLGGKFFFCINGEDQSRNDFIQKFIDNGCVLSW